MSAHLSIPPQAEPPIATEASAQSLPSLLDCLAALPQYIDEIARLQSSTTVPPWVSQAILTLREAVLLPQERALLEMVFGASSAPCSVQDFERFAKFRHLLYEKSRGLSVRMRVHLPGQAQSSDVKLGLPASISPAAVLFLRGALQDELQSTRNQQTLGPDGFTPKAISTFKAVRELYAQRRANQHPVMRRPTPIQQGLVNGPNAVDVAPDEQLMQSIQALPDSVSRAVEKGIELGLARLAAVSKRAGKGGLVASGKEKGEGGAIPAINPLTDKVLLDLIPTWRTYSTPTEKTADEAKNSIKKFDAFCKRHCGRRLMLSEISREIAIAWRDDYLTQPAYNRPGQTVSPTTIGKHFGLVSAVVSAYRLQYGLSDAHEFSKPFHRKTKVASAMRIEPFELNELKQIVSSGSYLNLNNSKADVAWQGLSFAIPFAAYTGARLEEIAQLKMEDFYCDKGVWFATIKSEPQLKHTLPSKSPKPGKAAGASAQTTTARRTKTLKSRDICLPDALMATRVGTRIQDMLKSSPDSHFIPGCEPDKWGKRSSPLSKAFARLLDEIGITERSKVFHSFRHTFEEFAKGYVGANTPLGVHREIIDAQIGHGTGGNNRNRYGSDKFPIERLGLAFSKFAYPGVIF